MQDIQEIFSRVNINKKKLKDLKSAYTDALKNSDEYRDLADELKTMREKKKSIETRMKEQFGSEFTQMEDIAIDIASDMELLSDIALTKIMKGESVELVGEHDEKYEPEFSVKFKKT
jgi:predicted  nucleic acid-binding Zn-ribbon protein